MAIRQLLENASSDNRGTARSLWRDSSGWSVNFTVGNIMYQLQPTSVSKFNIIILYFILPWYGVVM